MEIEIYQRDKKVRTNGQSEYRAEVYCKMYGSCSLTDIPTHQVKYDLIPNTFYCIIDRQTDKFFL